MRYFFSRRIPDPDRILLVESGSREMMENLIRHLRGSWCAKAEIDLVTCYAGLPDGFDPGGIVYRVSHYGTPDKRRDLVAQLTSREYSAIAILCSGEPIMTKWKWMLALRVPAKLLIVNESCDYFWAHYENLNTMRRFARVRMGLEGEGALQTWVRLCVFPFSVMYLALYAAAVHLRRGLRQMIHYHN